MLRFLITPTGAKIMRRKSWSFVRRSRCRKGRLVGRLSYRAGMKRLLRSSPAETSETITPTGNISAKVIGQR